MHACRSTLEDPTGPYQEHPQSKVGAQEAERRAIAEAVSGRPAKARQEPAKEVKTIEAFAKTFLELYAANDKPSEQRAKRRTLKANLVPAFGHLRLDEIRQRDVDTFVVAERKRGMSVKTVNNRLAVLSTLLRYAIKNGEVRAPEIPMSFKIPGMVGEISAVPMVDVDKLLAVEGDARCHVAVLLAAEAGLRAGEVRGLQWGDVKDGQLTVRRAIDKDSAKVIAPKHNKARKVPLSGRLKEALEALPKSDLWVLSREDGGPMPHNALARGIRSLYEKAEVELPPKPIHCLRHTFGTTMAGQGVPLPVLQALMGHADIKTTIRYVDVGEDQKRAAIARAFAWQPRGSGQSRAELRSV